MQPLFVTDAADGFTAQISLRPCIVLQLPRKEEKRSKEADPSLPKTAAVRRLSVVVGDTLFMFCRCWYEDLDSKNRKDLKEERIQKKHLVNKSNNNKDTVLFKCAKKKRALKSVWHTSTIDRKEKLKDQAKTPFTTFLKACALRCMTPPKQRKHFIVFFFYGDSYTTVTIFGSFLFFPPSRERYCLRRIVLRYHSIWRYTVNHLLYEYICALRCIFSFRL
jgi:hypothetical protein